MKVDLVMWTKNGEATLPSVLSRIDQEVPGVYVHRKIAVDDDSSDGTKDVLRRFGWRVFDNEQSGISSGANQALGMVETEKFCSFEQDLVLGDDWYSHVSNALTGKVVVASGMRFASGPENLRMLQKYVAKKYRGEKYLSSWLSSRALSAFTLGKTLDNTIYDTAVLRGLGGFPVLPTNAGVDTVLAYRVQKAGFDWKVDFGVQSVHLRDGLKDELQHQYSYGTQIRSIWASLKKDGVAPPWNVFSVLWRFCVSPLTGVFVAVKTRNPQVALIHLLIRTYYTRGLLKGAKK